MAERPVRRKPVHGVYHPPNKPTIVFDTVCVAGHRPILANDGTHERLRNIWLKANLWRVGRYVIMPDHIHYVVGATDTNVTLDNWVRYWKSEWCKQTGQRNFWQADHWDTRMRTAAQLEQKWLYVRRNPIRHGLVANEDSWPYQGTLFPLEW